MKRAIAIALAVGLVAVAIPASAHQETEKDACTENKNDCQPKGNHAWCTGIRDWGAYLNDGSLSILDVTLSQSETYTGVYVHVPTGGSDDKESPSGILFMEFNGFSGLQTANWNCKDLGPSGPDTSHGDTVII